MKKDALRRLDTMLHRPPYSRGTHFIIAGSNEMHARALVVTPPNPDLQGGRRNLIIDVNRQEDGKLVTKYRYLPFTIV